MSFTKEKVKEILLFEIERLYDVKIYDLNENLLNQKTGIPIEDFLYLFAKLDLEYGIDIYSVLAQNDYTVFTINNMASMMADKQLI